MQFDCSISENIAYGLKLIKSKHMSNGAGGMSHHNDPGDLCDEPDNHQDKRPRVVTMADVKRATMLACAHEFVAALPQVIHARLDTSDHLRVVL